MIAITITAIKRGIPMSKMRDCRGVGLDTCGHPESVSRGTSMLRSSFTALRYRPDAVPRRLRIARIGRESTRGALDKEDCCQVPARHTPSATIHGPAPQSVLRRHES
jgi:hypothetical protein